MTLHKDSTNLDVAIIYHLCQEKNLSDSPKFLGRLRLKQIFEGDNRQHSSHISNPFKSFSHWIFSCPETTMTDYYKDVVVNNQKLDDLSNYLFEQRVEDEVENWDDEIGTCQGVDYVTYVVI